MKNDFSFITFYSLADRGIFAETSKSREDTPRNLSTQDLQIPPLTWIQSSHNITVHFLHLGNHHNTLHSSAFYWCQTRTHEKQDLQ